MKRFITSLILACFVGTASADVVFVPTEISNLLPTRGQYSYRLVFATQGFISASEHDISIYNDFVNSQAALNPVLAGLSWTAIVSTDNAPDTPSVIVNARDNTNSVAGSDSGENGGDGIKIFNVGDERIADDYSDLWDGALDNSIKFDQFGVNSGADNAVWTGTSSAGIAATGLGQATGVTYGSRLEADSQWLNSNFLDSPLPPSTANTLRIYAMSEVITVPEPSSILCLGLVGGIWAIGRSRRRRKELNS